MADHIVAVEGQRVSNLDGVAAVVSHNETGVGLLGLPAAQRSLGQIGQDGQLAVGSLNVRDQLAGGEVGKSGDDLAGTQSSGTGHSLSAVPDGQPGHSGLSIGVIDSHSIGSQVAVLNAALGGAGPSGHGVVQHQDSQIGVGEAVRGVGGVGIALGQESAAGHIPLVDLSAVHHTVSGLITSSDGVGVDLGSHNIDQSIVVEADAGAGLAALDRSGVQVPDIIALPLAGRHQGGELIVAVGSSLADIKGVLRDLVVVRNRSQSAGSLGVHLGNLHGLGLAIGAHDDDLVIRGGAADGSAVRALNGSSRIGDQDHVLNSGSGVSVLVQLDIEHIAVQSHQVVGLAQDHIRQSLAGGLLAGGAVDLAADGVVIVLIHLGSGDILHHGELDDLVASLQAAGDGHPVVLLQTFLNVIVLEEVRGAGHDAGLAHAADPSHGHGLGEHQVDLAVAVVVNDSQLVPGIGSVDRSGGGGVPGSQDLVGLDAIEGGGANGDLVGDVSLDNIAHSAGVEHLAGGNHAVHIGLVVALVQNLHPQAHVGGHVDAGGVAAEGVDLLGGVISHTAHDHSVVGLQGQVLGAQALGGGVGHPLDGVLTDSQAVALSKAGSLSGAVEGAHVRVVGLLGQLVDIGSDLLGVSHGGENGVAGDQSGLITGNLGRGDVILQTLEQANIVGQNGGLQDPISAGLALGVAHHVQAHTNQLNDGQGTLRIKDAVALAVGDAKGGSVLDVVLGPVTLDVLKGGDILGGIAFRNINTLVMELGQHLGGLGAGQTVLGTEAALVAVHDAQGGHGFYGSLVFDVSIVNIVRSAGADDHHAKNHDGSQSQAENALEIVHCFFLLVNFGVSVSFSSGFRLFVLKTVPLAAHKFQFLSFWPLTSRI